MSVSQFQTPNYFLLALLEDYKMDPAAAQPILTVSVFDDLAETKDVVLLRCDIINRGQTNASNQEPTRIKHSIALLNAAASES